MNKTVAGRFFAVRSADSVDAARSYARAPLDDLLSLHGVSGETARRRINVGRYVAPLFAGSEISETADLSGRCEVGAPRVRLGPAPDLRLSIAR